MVPTGASSRPSDFSSWFSETLSSTAVKEMRWQTEMGLTQMMTKMNEALAKVFKGIGESIKGLA